MTGPSSERTAERRGVPEQPCVNCTHDYCECTARARASSERTADASKYALPWICPHGIDGRNCVKCADAAYTASERTADATPGGPPFASGVGSSEGMPQAPGTVLGDRADAGSTAAREKGRSVQAPRETADELAASLREYSTRSTGYIFASEVKVLREAAETLDRLVARNQQLQEALAEIAEKGKPMSGLLTAYGCAEIARVALASVRARTPA